MTEKPKCIKMISITKRQHDFYDSKKKRRFGAVGRWHYHVTKGKHSISIIKIFVDDEWMYESWGYRMHYQRRFNTLNDAIKDAKRRLQK